jgi:uracil phosphoribosyltransferase
MTNDKTMGNVHLIDHPLVQHKLTLMRNKEASTNSFRRLLNELAMLMAYEVTRDVALQDVEIETPMEKMTAKVIDGKKLVFVSILRAGTGILDGMLSVVPGARVGHIGLYRDPKTLTAVEYYFKMPQNRCWPPAIRRSRRWSGSRSCGPSRSSSSAC